MPTPRKPKSKARKSREADMLSDIGILDIMLGGNNLENEESESSNFDRRPDSPCYDTSVNQNTNYHSNSREGKIRTYAQHGQSLRETDSNTEVIRLSGELNQRIILRDGWIFELRKFPDPKSDK